MRILLTGTNGQVGGTLRPLLAMHGTVIAPSRTEFDLSKPQTLDRALDGFRPDLIINPAAYTAVDRSEDEHELAFRVNAWGPEAIAKWAARRRVPLIHFSTDYVFDGSGDKPWREDSPTGPLSVYGASKLAGDLAIGLLARGFAAILGMRFAMIWRGGVVEIAIILARVLIGFATGEESSAGNAQRQRGDAFKLFPALLVRAHSAAIPRSSARTSREEDSPALFRSHS